MRRSAQDAVRASLCVALLCSGLFSALMLREGPAPQRAARVAVSEDEIDGALQRAAKSALGGRDGTVLVMDPRTGRIRAVANSRLAFTEAFPPGSAIKPFTMLAALRAGLIDESSRVLCHEKYRRGDYATHCSHPRFKPPLDPAQALAYSCNYYFSKLGERLNEREFNETLTSFGFGSATGAGDEREGAGMLPHGYWRTATALGDDPQLLVTPVQLINAYAALVNGGHLFTPQYAGADNFRPQQRASLDIAPEHRALLLKGMRGVVAYGTAASAGLGSLPQYLFGKTGTAASEEDFHLHGWFVGLASEREDASATPPESVPLIVLVFLKRAHGAECARVARPIFEEYRRLQSLGPRSDLSDPDAATQPGENEGQAQGAASSSSPVRVRLIHEDRTQTLSLDDYVFGVLAAEGSVENEFEALKAQAVISRTYALRNRGRHARDGYDFCSSTHCQRYLGVRDESLRSDFYELLHRAVRETSGEVLLDQQGALADAYFSAACGGMTANIGTLWGTSRTPSYLRGVRDEYCDGGPYHSWTDVIPAARLAKALGADRRTDVGGRLNNLRVVERDATGRAQMIALEGERVRLVRGWDFKIIVGRELGWNMLKSTRFDVAREGASFVFHGSGFGHGLGLCQAGAHVMAGRGASYRQILDQYLPGTRLGRSAGAVTERAAATSVGKAWKADALLLGRTSYRATFNQPAAQQRRGTSAASRSGGSNARLTLASENFRVLYPARFGRREAEQVLRTLEEARTDALHRLSMAGVNPVGLSPLELSIHDSTGDFVGATGQPPWAAGATRGHRIELQPLDVLRRRGVLATTLRHEYAHAVIDAVGGGRTPRWLAEGLAAYFAGEGAMLARSAGKLNIGRDELERRLAEPSSAPEMRLLYAAAYREVAALIRSEGEPGVWNRIARG